MHPPPQIQSLSKMTDNGNPLSKLSSSDILAKTIRNIIYFQFRFFQVLLGDIGTLDKIRTAFFGPMTIKEQKLPKERITLGMLIINQQARRHLH
jgi:hypothetical protein